MRLPAVPFFVLVFKTRSAVLGKGAKRGAGMDEEERALQLYNLLWPRRPTLILLPLINGGLYLFEYNFCFTDAGVCGGARAGFSCLVAQMFLARSRSGAK